MKLLGKRSSGRFYRMKKSLAKEFELEHRCISAKRNKEYIKLLYYKIRLWIVRRSK
jgi:hypothetical protein